MHLKNVLQLPGKPKPEGLCFKLEVRNAELSYLLQKVTLKSTVLKVQQIILHCTLSGHRSLLLATFPISLLQKHTCVLFVMAILIHSNSRLQVVHQVSVRPNNDLNDTV